MENMVNELLKLSEKIHCMFIYHVQTYDVLCKWNLWDKINASKNITVVKRLPYCEFINCIYHSEFVVADGCGNQQEFYYLGKPYLIMRTQVEEESEGIGWNAVCFHNDFTMVDRFYREYLNYKKPEVKPDRLPSEIIVEELEEYFCGGKQTEESRQEDSHGNK